MNLTTVFFGDPGLIAAGLHLEVLDQADFSTIYGPSGADLVEFRPGGYAFQGSFVGTPSVVTVWTIAGAVIGGEQIAAPNVTFVPIVQPVPGLSVPAGTFYYKRGDDHVPLIGQFIWNGLPQDVSQASLLFKMRPQAANGPDLTQPMTVNGVAAHIPPPDESMTDDGSWWAYQPALTDFRVVGQYDAEIQATFPDTTVLTSPTTSDLSREYYTVVVVEDLDGA